MIGVLGREAVIFACRGCHRIQTVGIDELTPIRDFGFARLVANWLLGVFIDLLDVARGQQLTPVPTMFHAVSIVRSFDVPGAGAECSPPAAVIAVADK